MTTTKIPTPPASAEASRRARNNIASAIIKLGDARDHLDQLGAAERSQKIHQIILKLGTLLDSV